MALDRNAFLAGITTFKRKEITLDGLGGVCIRELSASEAEAFAKLQKEQGDGLHLAVWLAIHALCDTEGKPILTDADAEQVRQLPIRHLNTIGEEVGRLMGWQGDEAAKKNGTANASAD